MKRRPRVNLCGAAGSAKKRRLADIPAMAPTAAPTSWDAPEYDATDTVDTLHGYSYAGDGDYEYDGDMYAMIWTVCMIVGFFLMIVMWLFSCCSRLQAFRKCCTPFFGHCYGESGDHGLAAVFFVALLVLCCSYFPRGSFLDAAAEVGEAVGDLEKVFKNLDAEVVGLQAQDYSYSYWVDASVCPPPLSDDLGLDDVALTAAQAVVDAEIAALPETPQDMIRSYLAVFSDGVAALGEFGLGDLADKLAEGQLFIEQDLPEYIDIGMFLLTAFFAVIAAFGFIAALTKCQFDDFITVFLGSVILLVMIVFIGFEVSASVAIADYCYAGPGEATVALAEYAEVDEGSLKLATYYTSCEGENPFLPITTNLTEAFGMLNATAQSMKNQGFCDADSMNGLSETAGLTASSVQNVLGAVSCRALNIVFTGLTHDALCGPFLDGVYMCWVIHVTASTLIWAAFIGFPCVKMPMPEQGTVYVQSSDDGVQMK